MDDWNQINRFGSLDSMAIRVRRLERGEQGFRHGKLLTPSGKYAAIPASILDGDRIDLTSSGLLARGSIPPAGVKGNFGFSENITTITIYWDGTHTSNLLSILRIDGTVTQIPASSMTVSGLSSGTTYGFLPFWSAFNNCGIGFVVGNVGTPQFAFTAAGQTATARAQQNLQGREALTTNYITYATTVGGGGGTGGGGGGSSCIMLGSDIEPLGNSNFSTKHYPQTDWIHLQAQHYDRSLNCTPNHPLYHAERGRLRADAFKVGDWIITDQGERKISEVKPFVRVCTKVQVEIPNGHLFFANGYLSHNLKIQ